MSGDKARYIMIGGFLGSGKTTAILRIAERLRGRGQRVGLITNDQSYGLVDTAMLAARGFAVEEITGGCFCCRFSSLVEASDKLTAQMRPEVFIAEPVGSCTDLKATVDYPLRRLYGDNFSIAPLSVMVDPIRAARILGLETGKSFSQKVVYIYRKQLEEAETIIVNKTDLVTPEQLGQLVAALRREFPKAQVMEVCAREGRGIDEWIARLESGSPRTAGSMAVDYEEYAQGEALLGWVNCTVTVEAAAGVDGNALLLEIAGRVRELIGEEGEIAHLKLTLTPDEGNDIAVANLVRSDGGGPELSHRLQEELEAGQLIVNLRAEADPQVLAAKVREALEGVAEARSVEVTVEHLEAFRPGKPTPTHRLAGV